MPRDLRTRARALASIALPLLTAACAAGAGGAATEADPPPTQEVEPSPVRVVVENDLVPRTPVVIRLISGAGTRTFLGTVEGGRTAAFEITAGLVGEAELAAEETVTGDTRRSRRFVAHPGERVHWALRHNMIRVSRQ